MNYQSLLWLLGVVLVSILFPVAAAAYRAYDYKRQVSGKKKMRTYTGGTFLADDDSANTPEYNPEYDIQRAQIESMRAQFLVRNK